MAQFEIKKMKQGMSYSCKEKTIILNVFKYFRIQFPETCVTEIVRRTAKATGCSEKSIFQFRKEEASAEGFKEPSKTKIRRNININSRDIKYDSNVRHAIRYIIYDLKYRNVVPSLNTILKQVNGDASLPNFSLMTLRRLLFDMGFYYEKNGNKSVLVDKTDSASGSTENVPQQVANVKKPPVDQNQYVPNGSGNVEVKPMPNIPLNNTNMQVNHQIHHTILNDQQSQRLMPMHMTQPENHMMSAMHPSHGMQMMYSRRDYIPPPHALPPPPPPPVMDMHVKTEIPHWMRHPPYNIVKEQ